MVHKFNLSKLKIFLFINGERGISLFNYLKNKVNDITIIAIDRKKISKIKIKKKKIYRSINSKIFQSFALNQKPDLFILGGFPQILKKNVFEIPKYGTINLHAGKIPNYKGGSPLNWAIINGEKNFETTIIKINQGIDTGQVLVKKKSKILKYDTIKTIHKKANKNFNKIIVKAIENLFEKKYIKISNKNSKYWKQRNDKDNYLDLKRKNSIQSYNFIRALTKPYPCAWVVYKNKIIRIIEAEVISKNSLSNPGEVSYNKKLPVVNCLKGKILLKKYYFENYKKFKINSGDYIN